MPFPLFGGAPELTIVTMSRGDEARLEEWVRYHCLLGFSRFHIILDAPVDDSEAVLRDLDVAATITVDVRPPLGDYFDHSDFPDVEARWERIVAWQREHAREVGPPHHVMDPISWRQNRYLPPVLRALRWRGRGWVALIDVDEFIALRPGLTLADVLSSAGAPRVSLRNFNMDTSAWRPGSPLLESSVRRWSEDDLRSSQPEWAERVKTIAKYSAAHPFTTVHAISSGKRHTPDAADVRLLHFRVPLQPLDLTYPVEDTDARDAWRRHLGENGG